MKKMVKLGLLALSGVAAFSLASCSNNAKSTATKSTTTTTTTTTSNALSYSEYVAAENGEEVTISGYITGRTTWYNNAASFYLQDDNGGYYIYNLPCTESDYNTKLTVSTGLEVTGVKGAWEGQVEILGSSAGNEATYKVTGKTKTYTEKKVDTLANLANYPNQKVTIDVTISGKTKYGWDDSGTAGAGQDLYFDVTDGTTTYSFVVEAYLENTQYGSVLYSTVEEFEENDNVTLSGFVYTYGNPQLQVYSVTVKK